MAPSKTLKTFVLFLVFAMLLTQEVEARRKILKGRKSVTRTYLRPSPIPAWAIVVLVALGEVLVGVVVFFIMKRTVIDPPLVGSYTPAAIEDA